MRERLIWDREAREIVSRDEYEKRQARRAQSKKTLVIPKGTKTLQAIAADIRRWAEACKDTFPEVWPVPPTEWRRARAELKGKHDPDFFLVRGIPVVAGKGTFLFRKGLWVHWSIAGAIRRDGKSVNVMRDLADYRTAAADVAAGGKRVVIGSRSAHREFLRRNGYIELGNEMPQRRLTELPPVREDLERAYATGMTEEVRRAMAGAGRADPEMVRAALRHSGNDTRH